MCVFVIHLTLPRRTQVIAQALGGRVEANAAGFEIGGIDMALTPAATEYFVRLMTPRGSAASVPPALRMLYVHGCALPTCACAARDADYTLACS
jgi:hypothetical protein